MKARRANSPGSASLRLSILPNASSSILVTARLPWVCSSTTSSPVNDRGPGIHTTSAANELLAGKMLEFVGAPVPEPAAAWLLPPPKALVADPQGQESADQFCRQLRSLVPDTSIVLTGDSIDAGYAASQGLNWVQAVAGNPQPLLERVRRQMDLTIPRS